MFSTFSDKVLDDLRIFPMFWIQAEFWIDIFQATTDRKKWVDPSDMLNFDITSGAERPKKLEPIVDEKTKIALERCELNLKLCQTDCNCTIEEETNKGQSKILKFILVILLT